MQEPANTRDSELYATRPEVVIGALLYLVNAYRRSRCPSVASCIARHFDYLARDSRVDKLLRDIAAASIAEWEGAAREPWQKPARTKARFFDLPLH